MFFGVVVVVRLEMSDFRFSMMFSNVPVPKSITADDTNTHTTTLTLKLKLECNLILILTLRNHTLKVSFIKKYQMQV